LNHDSCLAHSYELISIFHGDFGEELRDYGGGEGTEFLTKGGEEVCGLCFFFFFVNGKV
jgi:hypothetical protein